MSIEEQRFLFKIFRGDKLAIIDEINNYSQEMLGKNFALKADSWRIIQNSEFMALTLFESTRSEITFSKTTKVIVRMVSEKDIKKLENSLTTSLKEMEEIKYYPSKIELLKDSDNFDVVLEYRHSNLFSSTN